jgi:alkanesulfonate monooxygenase SsuD/methylene tetrahydromethanopterin reductase-like flavin-dependent oxidoreductase (luciferase family)
MEFGIYHEFTSKAGRSDAESFDLALDIVDAAEEYGLDVMWLAELHFDPARAVLASPMVVGAAIAARTKRMKIGTSVQVLPLSNPLRLAEEAATLDQLSHGRLIFGAGRSGVAKTYENYNIPYAESKERFNEALEIIERAWRETDFSHKGKYYQFEEVTVAPRPYQQPTPEVRVAAASADTFPTLGQEGRGMFISVRHEDASHFLAPIQIYRSEWAKAGHAGNGRVYLRAPGFVASTAAKAREAYEPTLMHHFRAQARLLADSARRLGQGPENPRWKTVERLENITYDEAIRGSIYVGTPDMVIEKLQATDRDIGGMAGIQLEFNCGGLADHAAERESMRLLCQEVKPAFAS